MTSKKISELTAATTSALARLPAVQGGANTSITSELLVTQTFNALPEIIAGDRGFSSSNTAAQNSTALDAMVASLATGGGIIKLPSGTYNWAGTASLKAARGIILRGAGGQNAGGTTGTVLSVNTASGSRIVDARDSFGVAIEDLYLLQSNTSFAGHLVDFGIENIATTPGSSFARVRNCTLINSGTGGGYDLNVYGSTQGNYEHITFGGPRHILMQDTAGVGFANSILFRRCDFRPSGTAYPVFGSGEGITFLTCNLQASTSDLKMRFWQTSTNQDFRGVQVIGFTGYDAGASGYVTMDFKQGEGLTILGGEIGGVNAASTYQIQLGGSGTGVRGFVIEGVSFRGGAAAINLPGVVGSGTHAHEGIIGANSVYGGTLLAGTGINNVVLMPNYIEGGANDLGAHFNIIGLPTSAASLQTGDWYNSAGTVKVA